MADSTAILVLGMPRSGTSAVTRVLNLHGASLSDKLLPAAKPNPKGFFESADALAIHERLLKAMGRNWYDIAEMPEGWLDLPQTLEAQRDLEALVKRDYFDKTIWVIKEPRMCRLVPLWIRVLESLDIKLRVLLVTRHPEEVVRSVARMVGEDQWSPEHTKILWLEYFFEAEKHTRGLSRALITYDQLLNDWEFHIDRIAHELSIQWPISSTAAKPHVDDYLGAENRHHRHCPAERVPETELSLAENVYITCNEMKGDYWSALKSLYSEFSAVFAFFQRPMQDLIHKAATEQVSMMSIQQSELDELRNHHNTVFFSQQTELNELRRYHSEVFYSQKSELDTLRSESEAARLRHQSEVDELRRQGEELANTHAVELSELRKQKEALILTHQAELEELTFALGHAKDEVATAQREREALTAALNKRTGELDVARIEEKKVSSALLELQSSYATLVSLAGSKKWLLRRLFTTSNKN